MTAADVLARTLPVGPQVAVTNAAATDRELVLFLVAGGFGLPLVSRLVVFPVLAEEVGLGRIVKVTTLGPNVVMADVRALLSFERDGDRLRLGTIGFLGSAPSAGQPVYLATGETESALASAAGNTWHRATGEDQRQDEA